MHVAWNILKWCIKADGKGRLRKGRMRTLHPAIIHPIIDTGFAPQILLHGGGAPGAWQRARNVSDKLGHLFWGCCCSTWGVGDKPGLTLSVAQLLIQFALPWEWMDGLDWAGQSLSCFLNCGQRSGKWKGFSQQPALSMIKLSLESASWISEERKWELYSELS